MLELCLWYKPKMFFSELASAFGNYSWKAGTLLCQMFFVVVAVMAWIRLEIPSSVRGVLSSALLATGMMSLLPVVWTYPIAHVVGEQFLIWIALLLYLATLFLSKA